MYTSSYILFAILVFFFFSSRRRHTRLVSDWSSDVCSSDLSLHRRDEPRGTLVEEVIPRPVQQHEQLVAKSDELDDVDHQPHHPRREPGEPDPPDVGDGGVPTDGREGAGIAVAERHGRLSGDAAQ